MLDKPQRTALLDEIAGIVGARYVLTEASDQAAYLTEMRNMFHGCALAVVRPGSTAEVGKLLALASRSRTPVVPQGGNTGLVGGQVPDASGDAIILSLTRLDKVREVDPLSNTMTVEAGLRSSRPRKPPPRGSALSALARFGGLLRDRRESFDERRRRRGARLWQYARPRARPRGGARRWARMNGLSKLRKDNTGYDLKHLFVGAEGTLGIITAAVLKLFARPRARSATAFVAVESPAAALELSRSFGERVGERVTGFELISRICLDFGLPHSRLARSACRAPRVVRAGGSSRQQAGSTVDSLFEAALGEAVERGTILDAALAASRAQRAEFWKLRENIPEAQKVEGVSIKHDVSVPVSRVPELIVARRRRARAPLSRRAGRGLRPPGRRQHPLQLLGAGTRGRETLLRARRRR